MKKTMSILLTLGMLCSLSACMTASADDGRLPGTVEVCRDDELKHGRYYLDGGDDTQYIEISENFGIEFVGFDFYQEHYDLNREVIEQWEADGNTEQVRLVLNGFREEDALRNSYRYYQYEHIVDTPYYGSIIPKQLPDYFSYGGWGLTLTDENTIQYTEDKIYVYRDDSPAAVSLNGEIEPVTYENHEIKCGKYYLAGGDDTQYIEIGEDYVFHMSYDCYPSICDQNREYLTVLEENGNTEQLQNILDFYRQTADERSALSYYQLSPYSGAVQPKAAPEYVSEVGWVMSMPDENTIRYAEDVLFVYREE